MRFEWDEAKRLSNIQRHGFDFVGIESAFTDYPFTILDDRFNYEENRFVTFGMFQGRVVAIVHTETDDVTRIISVRKASKNEEELYYKEIKD